MRSELEIVLVIDFVARVGRVSEIDSEVQLQEKLIGREVEDVKRRPSARPERIF